MESDQKIEEIVIPRIYKPFFELIEGALPNVHTVVCTGGRYSGKSHTTNLGLAHAVSQFGHRLLHVRYTMTSADQSIIPDFNDKLEILGASEFYKINKTTLESTFDNSRVFFKGMKTGSKTQDAALKSLSDVSIFCTEEASEIPTFEEWDKIRLSVRAKDVQPFSLLILNPTSTNHWIYEKFFSDKGVPAGFNGIVDGVLYIHSTWEDLDEDMITPMHLKRFKEAKAFYEDNDFNKLTDIKQIKLWKWYDQVVLGGWRSSVENVIFEEWNTFKEWPTEEPIYHLLGLDFGFNDPTVLGETRVYENDIYHKIHCYKPGMTNQEIADAIIKAETESGKLGDIYTVADSADKRTINELREKGISIVKCKKGDNSIAAGIQKIKGYNLYIYFESTEMHVELNNYEYIEKISPDGSRKVVPIDNFNHAIDELRYTLSLY